MPLFKLSEHWLHIGFSARFYTPFSTSGQVYSTRSSTRRSTWDNIVCKQAGGSEDAAPGALCVQETRDVLAVDLFHEAELKNSDCPMDFSDSESSEEIDSSESDEEIDIVLSDKPAFDATLDNENLYLWKTARDVLVIDSTTPWLAPHIAITPASDTLADLTTIWFNQPNYQNPENLSLPLPDLSENPHPPLYPYSSPTTTPPSPGPYPIPVFSPTKFNAMIESCSAERLSYFNVVIAVRRQLVKAVAFAAGQVAKEYRQRYDIALPFSDIERPFSWSDPAEPILLASRFHRATLILDSPNPFRAPHIIINQPPPEDQWATASNLLNDPQDCGFGRYLVVPARGITYINEPEDSYSEYEDSGEGEYYDTFTSDEDQSCEALEEQELIRFAEQDEDYGESYCSTLDLYCSFVDIPELDTTSLDSVESPFPQTPDTLDDEEDFKTAFERALERRTICSSSSVEDSILEQCESAHPDDATLERPICTPLDEDVADQLEPLHSSSWADEEDELPPINDEWYQSVIRRTQSVIAA